MLEPQIEKWGKKKTSDNSSIELKHTLLGKKLKSDKIPFIKSERKRKRKNNRTIMLYYVCERGCMEKMNEWMGDHTNERQH